MFNFLTFNRILNQATKYFLSLPEYQQKKIKENLDHGKAILDDNNQLKGYIALYGEIHRKKLTLAFNHLPKDLIENDFSLIDWGCGQGLDSILFHEYLAKVGRSNIRDIVLIEPSAHCLSVATNYVQWTISDADIYSIAKKEEDLTLSDFPLAERTTIHILANIIDMPEFYGNNVLRYLNSNKHLRHILICVSPFYPIEGRGQRMYRFGEKLNGFKRVYCFQRHIDDWKENYSCQIHIYDNKTE